MTQDEEQATMKQAIDKAEYYLAPIREGRFDGNYEGKAAHALVAIAELLVGMAKVSLR
jgi:hypothetical protein